MTRTEAYTTITRAAEQFGFQTSIEPYRIWIKDDDRHDVNFNVTEHNHFNIADGKVTEVITDFEFSASIARMGGNPTPAKLIESSNRIGAAANLVTLLQSLNLSFTEEIA